MTVPTALSSALEGRYHIERELGAGGMATVYLANDLKHQRHVALKLLKPELAATLGSERFLREIQVVAHLTHPHILPLYDSGVVGSLFYYVMPRVDGETLRALLGREKQLAVANAVQIVSQVGDALDYAHECGVIHRDVKPENILLSRGHALLTDFGVARAAEPNGVEALTEVGVAVGTPAYMSPEQATGERVDARSDIYTLGCVLYEMLVGTPPFTGPSIHAVIAARFKAPAPNVRESRPDVPEHIANAVRLALEADPAHRLPTARALVQSLTGSSIRVPDRTTRAILVLPFANVSPDSDTEYFSDGLTEEVIADLSKVAALRVISRSSTMKLKGTNKRPRDLAAELDVRYVLEGSVRRAGDNLRIIVQMMDTFTEQHVWSEKYSGTLHDVFDIQEKLSREIVRTLRVHLTTKEDRRMADRPIPNLAAFDCYLRARQGIVSFSAEGLEQARGHLERGLDVLGENPLLLRGMGQVLFQQLNAGVTDDRSRITDIEGLASRIADLDATAPHAEVLTGLAHLLRGQFRAAIRHLRLAHEADPADPDTMLWLGVGSLSTGQTTLAAELLQQLVAVDPLNALNHMLVGYALFFRGRFAEAVAPTHKALQMGDDTPVLLWASARILWAAGHEADARAVFERLERAHPNTLFTRAARALALAIAGRGDEAERQITPEVEDWASHDGEWAHFLANTYAMAGRHERALDWLERAIASEFINYPFLASHDPYVASLRPTSRFQELLAKAQREWHAFNDELGTSETYDPIIQQAALRRSQSNSRL